MDSSSYTELLSFVRRSEKTSNDGLYHYENKNRGVSVLYEKEIKDSLQNIEGYFFVVAEPKKYMADDVIPELFKQAKEAEDELTKTYAVYNKGELLTSSGNYNFLAHIPKNQLLRQEYKEIRKGRVKEFWYNGAKSKLVIIVRTGNLFIESITLFAYLFVSFLFIIVVFQLCRFLVGIKFSYNRLKTVMRLNIRH